ncbi:MAG: T9SS type A sorting domain-containing protein [Bacteroidota bacterium]
MKKSMLTLFAVVFLCRITTAFTNVSGVISTNTIWDLAGSPYIITGLVTVQQATLTILPGVTVKFNDGQELYVHDSGKLIALGTVTDSITFMSNSQTPTIGIYVGIYGMGSSSSPYLMKFNYCNFLYSHYAIYINLGSTSDTLNIKNSTFNTNTYGLFGQISGRTGYVDSSNFINNTTGINTNFMVVTNTIFSSNQKGIDLADDGLFTNCKFLSNQTGVFTPANAKFYNCEFISNQRGILPGLNNNIVNCRIDSNSVYGILPADWDSIIHCSIKYNKIGIKTSLGNNPVLVSDCEIAYDSVGVYNSGGQGPLVIQNNSLQFNRIGVEVYHQSGWLNLIMNENVFENDSIGFKVDDMLSISNISCNKFCNNTYRDVFFHSIIAGLNISNNYWCTTDTSMIESRIFDGHDSSGVHLLTISPVDSLQCYQSITTSAHEVTLLQNTISLYPNPTTSTLTIHQDTYSPSQQIIITDVLGNKVYSQALNNSTETIDISQLSSGIYFYEVSGKRGKIVKE